MQVQFYMTIRSTYFYNSQVLEIGVSEGVPAGGVEVLPFDDLVRAIHKANIGVKVIGKVIICPTIPYILRELVYWADKKQN